MKRNTILETITAIVFIIFVSIVLYYSFYPFKITTLNSISIDSTEYCRGEWVQIKINFDKHMDVHADTTWYIVDGVVYELESPGVNREVGHNDIIVSKQIPYSILPGNYNLRVESVYRVHPLHKDIVNTWNTPKFEVLDADQCPSNPDENLSFPDPINKPTDEKPVVEDEHKPQTIISEEESTPLQDLIENVTSQFKKLLQ